MKDGQIVHKTLASGVWSLEFLNSIDESVPFPDLPPSAKGVAIDLGGVTYINSSGIRNWTHWIAQVMIKFSTLPIEISRMPLSFIRAVNLIEEVLPKGVKVKSFYANYYCANCANEKAVLVMNAPGVKIPAEKCAACKEALELELAPELYDAISRS